MKKIVAFSSEYAGHGHKSLCESLRQELDFRGEDVEFVEVNGFTFGGKPAVMMEKQYIPMVTYMRAAWAVTYRMTSDFSKMTNSFAEIAMEKRFLQMIEEEKPDLLVSVHAGFVDSVQQILQSNGISIPMVTVVADLDNISKLWYSDKCGVYMCPSEESLESLKKYGLKESQEAYVSGLPVRRMFREYRQETEKRELNPDAANVLILCTTEKYFRMRDFLDSYIPFNKHNITLITGRNPNLYYDLRKFIIERKWEKRVKLLEYCPNFYKILSQQDIFIGKGGPNAIMECANIGVPMISIGTLPGQEAKNEAYMLRNNIGRVCKGIRNAGKAIDDLLADGGAEYREIRESQRKLTEVNASAFIVDKCMEMLRD